MLARQTEYMQLGLMQTYKLSSIEESFNDTSHEGCTVQATCVVWVT